MAGNGDRPGLLRLVGAALLGPLEERYQRQLMRRVETAALESTARLQEQAAKLVADEEPGWVPVNAKGDRGDLDPTVAQDLRQEALRASLHEPLLIGYLRTLLRFVMGAGAKVSVETDDERLRDAIQDWFREFHEANEWDVLEDEIPWRLWRDGDLFLRFFELEAGRSSADVQLDPAVQKRLTELRAGVPALEGPVYPAGMLLLRVLAAEHVQDPRGTITGGIVCDARDVQTPLAYLWAPPNDRGLPEVREVIPAGDVLHARVRVDSDVKRGRSLLEPLLQGNKNFADWLRYRLLLNLARTAIVLVKEIEGTPTQVRALRDAQATQRETDPTTNQRKLQMLKPMTTVHASAGVKYNMLAPNLNAQDAQHDGRALQLLMAAGTGMPEYIFTGDASNANYASTLVAEGPAMREFQHWQDFLGGIWRSIHRRALVAGARANGIQGLKEAEARTIPITVTWPPLLERDELKHAQAVQIKVDIGVLSKEGAAEDTGVDWDVEKERLAREGADQAEALAAERERLAAQRPPVGGPAPVPGPGGAAGA